MVRLPGEICALLTLLIVDLSLLNERRNLNGSDVVARNWLEAMQTLQIAGSLA